MCRFCLKQAWDLVSCLSLSLAIICFSLYEGALIWGVCLAKGLNTPKWGNNGGTFTDEGAKVMVNDKVASAGKTPISGSTENGESTSWTRSWGAALELLQSAPNTWQCGFTSTQKNCTSKLLKQTVTRDDNVQQPATARFRGLGQPPLHGVYTLQPVVEPVVQWAVWAQPSGAWVVQPGRLWRH